AVRLQGAEGQLHDAVEQVVDVGDEADGLAQLVEDADVGEQLVGQGGADLLGVGEDAAALALGDGLDDGAGQLDVLAGDQADLLGEVAGGRHVAAAAGDDEQGLADLHLVAGLDGGFGDVFVVDEGAVGAADVAQQVALAVV